MHLCCLVLRVFNCCAYAYVSPMRLFGFFFNTLNHTLTAANTPSPSPVTELGVDEATLERVTAAYTSLCTKLAIPAVSPTVPSMVCCPPCVTERGREQRGATGGSRKDWCWCM